MNASNYSLSDDSSWLIERLTDDVRNATTTISTNGSISITGSLVLIVQSTTTTTAPPSSPATVLVVVNVTSNSAYFWSTTAAQEDLDQISTALLWLPYVIFTIVLLGLIAVSFLRFHCERGNQYRRRQAEISDKLQHGSIQDSLRLLPTSTQEAEMMTNFQLGGGVSLMPGSALQQPNGFGPTKDGIPQHMNLFVQYSQINPGSKAHDEEQEDDTCQIVSIDEDKQKKKHHPQLDDELSKSDHKSKKMFFFSGKDNRKKGGSTGSGSRRPIVFTFNCNGSMVDVRCDNEERTNTFRLSGMNYLSDDPTSIEYDKHRTSKRPNKQLAAKYSKSRPHLPRDNNENDAIAASKSDVKMIRQNTLPPQITNGLPNEPTKRLVKNQSFDIAPSVSTLDPLKHGVPSSHFMKFSNPSAIIIPSSTPLLFSQAAFTQMHLTSVNFAASLMSPQSSALNVNRGIIHPAIINLPLSPPETSLGIGITRPIRPHAELPQQAFLNSHQMFTQPTYTFPSSQRQHHQQHQFPTLLQSPTSESAYLSQQNANKERLLIQMHQQQSLLQQKLLQNKQQFTHFKQQHSFDREPFVSYAMEGLPSWPQRPQHSCPHQPKSTPMTSSQEGQQLIISLQAMEKLQQARHQQPTKVSVHQPVRMPQDQNATGQTSKRPGPLSKQQRSMSQETPQRCRSSSKTTQPFLTQQQFSKGLTSTTASMTATTTYPSSLAHQPFFSARRQHNKNAQTIFAANRAPIFGTEKRSRETEIENEALLLWRKQI